MITVWQDLNGDGVADRLSINLIRGREYVDEELWCGGSGTTKIEGVFEICVEFTSGTPVCTPLNPLLIDPNVYWQYGRRQLDQPDLWFRAEPWTLELADYNHDGGPDFALGQYSGCRGWDYTMLTVEPNGTIARILDDHIFVKSQFGNSICFDLTAHGFRYTAFGDPDWYACREYARIPGSNRVTRVKETPAPCPEVDD